MLLPLILPLTTNANFTSAAATPTGAVFRITRRGAALEADFVGPIGVFPCAGARDEESERALAAAFERGGFRRVKRLVRGDDAEPANCWVKAPGWSLLWS